MLRKLPILLISGMCAVMACSMPNLNPFSSPDNAPKPPPHTTDLGVVGEATNLAYQWWWMSLVLVLFFPQIRQPILQFWSAIFRSLTVPFEFIRMKWELYSVRKVDK